MEVRPVDRLIAFVEWAKVGNLISSRSEFERKCGLSNNYLYNTQFMTRSSIGTDQLVKIHAAFPELNLVWVITGKGSMITRDPDEGYKEAYENLRKEINKLKKIVNNL